MMKKYLLGLITLGFITFLWHLNALRIDNHYLFPYPIDIFRTLIRLVSDANTYIIIGYSFRRLFISIMFASSFAILLGLFAGLKSWVSDLLNPIVTSLRTLPVASVIVVILILYGQSLSLYIITFLMLFPIIFEATKQGVINIDKSLIEALTLEKRRHFLELFYIYLPLSSSYIKTGFLQSIGLGFKVLVMAEFIAQSPMSIGRALYLGRINIQYDVVFAWTIIIIVLVTIIEHVVNRLKKSVS